MPFDTSRQAINIDTASTVNESCMRTVIPLLLG